MYSCSCSKVADGGKMGCFHFHVGHILPLGFLGPALAFPLGPNATQDPDDLATRYVDILSGETAKNLQN